MSTADTGCQPIKELFSQVLDLPPNCLKFSEVCPDHFVIGTYFLEEDPDAQPKESDIEEKIKDLDISKKQETPESKKRQKDWDEQGDTDVDSDRDHSQPKESIKAPEQGDTDVDSDREDDSPPKENIKAPAQKRSGMLILCKLAAKTESNGGPGVEVVTLQKLVQPSAVYDLHFKNNVLVTTSTTGTLSLFELVPPGRRGHGKYMSDTTVLPIKRHRWQKEVHARACFFQHAIFADIPPMENDPDEPGETDKVKIDPKAAYLQHIGTWQLFDTSTLVISLDWHTIIENMFAVSLSNGSIAVVRWQYRTTEYLNDSSLAVLPAFQYLQKHTDNPWCVLWGGWYLSKWHGDGDDMIAANIYSGGDDCKIRYVRLMLCQGGGGPDRINREIQISDSGVTALARLGCIKTAQSHTDVLLVGSYDNKVRILSVCTPLEPKFQYEVTDHEAYEVFCPLNLGGTIHKLSVIGTSNPTSISEANLPPKTAVLASCAHIGVRLLLVTWSSENQTFQIEVVAKFEGHDSMNYASDVLLKEWVMDRELRRFMQGERMEICVSTSFYDRLMCVWGFKRYW